MLWEVMKMKLNWGNACAFSKRNAGLLFSSFIRIVILQF